MSPLGFVIAIEIAVAVVAALGIVLDDRAELVLGQHRAVKPLKFAVSIATLLATVQLVLDRLDGTARIAPWLAWPLAVGMVVETLAIGIQALRGVPSHFNERTPFDRALWHAMLVAIVTITLTLIGFAGVVTTHALAVTPLVALAIRVGAWTVLLAAISGFAMGGRLAHAVGGRDGHGPARRITGWSRAHGDLRVPHFFALHALQAIPGLAWLVEQLPLPAPVRVALWGLGAAAWLALSLGSLRQAFAGRPWVRAAL